MVRLLLRLLAVTCVLAHAADAQQLVAAVDVLLPLPGIDELPQEDKEKTGPGCRCCNTYDAWCVSLVSGWG